MNYDLLRQIYDNEWGINPMTFPSHFRDFVQVELDNPSPRFVCHFVLRSLAQCSLPKGYDVSADMGAIMPAISILEKILHATDSQSPRDDYTSRGTA